MNKKLVVRQNSYKDCAVACLIYILIYYGIDPPYEELSYYLRVSKDGVNAYNLINGSKNYGFDGYGVHYSFEDIIDSKVMFPIICHTISNNMYHFIVIYKVNRNSILIMDPSSNKNKISFDEFKKIYLGTSIVIYPIKKIDSISNHKTLTNFILEYLITIKKEVLLVFLLSLIVVILNLIINYFLTILIDNNYEINIIISLSLVFAIITIFKNIFTFIREKFLLRIENNIMSYINININRKLFNLPYLFFKNKSTGEIESRINDLSTFRDIISNVIVGISIDIIFIICSFIILFFINYKLLLN